MGSATGLPWEAIFEATAFTIIAVNFIILVLMAVRIWLVEAFRKPVLHEAVILQFRPRSRKGHFHG